MRASTTPRSSRDRAKRSQPLALRSLAVLTAAAIAAAVCSARVAAAADANEYALLQRIPARVLDTVTNNSEPDSNGAMQLNQARWTDIVYQRIAIPLIWVGAVENDTSKIDDGWKAIDFANAHMTQDGGFSTAPGRTMNESEMAFWIAAVTHAFAVLNESPLGSRYAQREATALAAIRKNVEWLNADQRVANLVKFDGPATNRLFDDANAFAYSSLLLKDPQLQKRGEYFLQQALAHERSDGVFLEDNGYDSSYQGASLLNATYYALLGENTQLRNALLVGTNREVEAVDTRGGLDTSQNTRTGGNHMVDGHPYVVDLRAVILGLYYAGAYLELPSATAAAGRIYVRVTHRSPDS